MLQWFLIETPPLLSCKSHGYFLVQKSVRRSSFSRDGLAFQFWSRFLLRIEIGAKLEIRTIEMWTKIELGHVGINFEEKIGWAKIGSSKQAHHVKINSFKHFTGPKKIPEYFFRYIIYIIYNPIYNIYHILNRDWIKLAFSVTWRFFSIPMWIKKWILLMSHLQITVT